MKLTYVNAEIEVVELATDDVIVTSGFVSDEQEFPL